MNFIDKVMDRWNALREKARPVLEAVAHFLRELAKAFDVIWKYIYRLRKVFMAIPVGWGAVSLALYNQANLPAVVGLDLQTSGDFNIQVVRELAVLGPLALTAVCLLLMFVSRRTLTPWMVSLFSLAVPVLILVTNIFPS